MTHLLASVRSGVQTGVDIAALRAARALGLPTAGTMPRGFRTLAGPRPEYAALYGCTEDPSPEWAPRTRANVEAADVTLRIAARLDSAGERCTLTACRRAGRPCLDVLLDPATLRPRRADIEAAVGALRALAAKLGRPIHLNVAGNSERTVPGIETAAEPVIRALLVRAATTLHVHTLRLTPWDGNATARAHAHALGAHLLDITRGSGGPEAEPFAPPWSLLRPALAERRRAQALKRRDPEEADRIEGAMWAGYESAFLDVLRSSWRGQRDAWERVLLGPTIALGCGCAPWRLASGEEVLHCHRVLVQRALVRLGAVAGGAPPPPR